MPREQNTGLRGELGRDHSGVATQRGVYRYRTPAVEELAEHLYEDWRLRLESPAKAPHWNQFRERVRDTEKAITGDHWRRRAFDCLYALRDILGADTADKLMGLEG